MQIHVKKLRTGKFKKLIRKLRKEKWMDSDMADDLLEDLDDIEEQVEMMRQIALSAIQELMRFKSRGDN